MSRENAVGSTEWFVNSDNGLEEKSTDLMANQDMSLKFGIYLVEQRIISPEQFCGLVKVQQEATRTIASIAIRKNVLTINQVARILDLQDTTPAQSFLQVAIAHDLLEVADANELSRQQELSCPTIRDLAVECGLLTKHQTVVLFQHFEKQRTASPTMRRGHGTSVKAPPKAPIGHRESIQGGPPRPKFQQRPVIVSAYSESRPTG